MASIRKIRMGLEILEKYTGADGEVDAQHDIIYAGPESGVVSEEDFAKLRELGWRNNGEGWEHFT